MTTIYEDGTYLDATGSWHAEDSDWKAEQIVPVLDLVPDPIERVVEIGCGAGGVIRSLASAPRLRDAELIGFDISPQAIELADHPARPDNLRYENRDPLSSDDDEHYDLLMAIDVFEHVPDYLGFLNACRAKARFKLYHIPLDLHVSSLLRDRLSVARASIGHLHYFTARTAIATLEDTGHRIVDQRFTDGARGLLAQHPSLRRRAANVPRRTISRFSTEWAATLLGGYSLLVLAE